LRAAPLGQGGVYEINENMIEDLAKEMAILFSMDNSDAELQLMELKNDVTLVNFRTDIWKILKVGEKHFARESQRGCHTPYRFAYIMYNL
jgi:hypothetical protein